MSFVFNRQHLDFGDPERDLLEQMRPVLAGLFRASVMLAQWRAHGAGPNPADLAGEHGKLDLRGDLLSTLTSREREVLGWVTAGKTNAQIADILGASPATVAKHLERIYEKLGVESAHGGGHVCRPPQRLRHCCRGHPACAVPALASNSSRASPMAASSVGTSCAPDTATLSARMT